MSVVVEFQRIELTRLLRENRRLHRRLGELIGELNGLRDLLAREQALRAGQQAFVERLVNRLTAVSSLSEPSVPELPVPELPVPELPVPEPPVPEPPVPEAAGPDMPAPGRAVPEASPSDAPVIEAGAQEAGKADSPCPPAPPDAEPPRASAEVADLARLMEEIGRSLHDDEEDIPVARAQPPTSGPSAASAGAGESEGRPAEDDTLARAAVVSSASQRRAALAEIMTRIDHTPESRRRALSAIKRLLGEGARHTPGRRNPMPPG